MTSLKPIQKTKMVLLLPFFVMCLSACTTATANDPSLYAIRPWPPALTGDFTQKDVAHFIEEAEASYKSCAIAIDILKDD